jgi:protein-disulfide isomerase
MNEQHKEYITPGAILIAGAMISLSIMLTNGISFPPTQGLTAKVADTVVTEDDQADAVGKGPELTGEDYIRGNPNAPITLVEYYDFECPFCARFHPTVQQAMAEYGDQIRWVYRHFPLTQIHPSAVPSAEASECVAEQKGNEGFWQFADAMFEAQSEGLTPALYRETAERIGVNLAQYDDCVATRKYKEKVERAQAEGLALGVNGTPGSFVNGTPVRGAIPYANLKQIIDAELQALEG